jgi:hypothetical protein
MAHRNFRRLVALECVLLVVASLAGAFACVTKDRAARPGQVKTSAVRASTTTERQVRDVQPSMTQTSAPSKKPPAPPTTPPPTNAPAATNAPAGGRVAAGSTTTCPLPVYPSANCTGVPPGTALRVHNGDLEISTANTVIDALDVRGCVRINAPGVVIRRTRITCPGSGVGSFADSFSGVGAILEDVEISCGNVNGSSAVGDYNFTVRRANIHSCENGFDVDGRVTIEHSYIHDLLAFDPVSDPHTDGAQITPVGRDIEIVHNTIYAGDGTSAIISPPVSAGVVTNVLIADNLMAGGAYTLYCQQDGQGNNYRVVNNHFSTRFYPSIGAFGAWTECGDETQVSGNVIHETGRPVLA